MRLLLFSDLHCDRRAALNLVERARAADVVIGAGDFATMRKGLPEIIDVLSSIACPAILVPGNGESQEELSAACKVWPSALVLHGSSVDVEGVTFWGVGGAIPTTQFGAWSYDFSEDEGRQLLAGCPEGAVLVSHSPPKGMLDRSSSGQSLGSQAVLETVEQRRPPLVVCGHVHDSSGKSEKHGQSTVINAGPQGMTWEL